MLCKKHAVAERNREFCICQALRESHRLQPFFSPKGAEMRQAVRKVRHSDTRETMMAEQLLMI